MTATSVVVDPAVAGRAQALDWVEANGYPTRRDEAWRYAPHKALGELSFGPPVTLTTDLPDIDALIPALDGPRIVIVNGVVDVGAVDDGRPGRSAPVEPARGPRRTARASRGALRLRRRRDHRRLHGTQPRLRWRRRRRTCRRRRDPRRADSHHRRRDPRRVAQRIVHRRRHRVGCAQLGHRRRDPYRRRCRLRRVEHPHDHHPRRRRGARTRAPAGRARRATCTSATLPSPRPPTARSTLARSTSGRRSGVWRITSTSTGPVHTPTCPGCSSASATRSSISRSTSCTRHENCTSRQSYPWRARRCEYRCVQRWHRGAAGCRWHRRRTVERQPHPVGSCRDQHPAAPRDPRRRSGLQTRCHRRTTRRHRHVLHALARHTCRRGAPAADQRLRRSGRRRGRHRISPGVDHSIAWGTTMSDQPGQRRQDQGLHAAACRRGHDRARRPADDAGRRRACHAAPSARRTRPRSRPPRRDGSPVAEQTRSTSVSSTPRDPAAAEQ